MVIKNKTMFNKVKQGRELMKMRSEAKALQKKLAEVTDTAEVGNVRVKVAGDQSVVYVEIDGQENKDIVKAINEANKKVQKKAAQKMVEEGGLGALFSGMQGMK